MPGEIQEFPDPGSNPDLGIKFSTTDTRLFSEPTLLSQWTGATASGMDDQNAEAGFIGVYVGSVFAPEKRIPENADLIAVTPDPDVQDWEWCQIVPQPYTNYLLQYWDSGQWVTYSEMRYISGGLNYKQSSGLGNYFRRYFPITVAQLTDPRTDRFGAVGGYIIYQNKLPFVPSNFREVETLWPDPSATGWGMFTGPKSTAKGWTFAGPQPNAGFTTAYYGQLSDNLANSLTHYTDPDGVLRPGDGAYADANSPSLGRPLMTGNFSSRPIVLDRPFRSVAEMGYASRGVSWKHLDFFTKDSADSALLDLFTVDEAPEIVAGTLSLNTRRPETLEAILRGTVVVEETNQKLTDKEASQIASAVVNLSESSAGPFLNRSELATRLAPVLSYDFNENTVIKRRREAAIRALSNVTDTRTWNLFLDIVAQSGRFPGKDTKESDFIVEGEKRIWLQIAIDRYMGKVIEQRVEPAYE